MEVIFTTTKPVPHPSCLVGVVGRGPDLGDWVAPIVAYESIVGCGTWQTRPVKISGSKLEFKLVILDQDLKITEWENDDDNRQITIITDMKYIVVDCAWGERDKFAIARCYCCVSRGVSLFHMEEMSLYQMVEISQWYDNILM